ncbi:MAG: hypothetical protein KAT65_18565 [Methanophagales archaeon]|nr:hypothetical protein [Methanophagales archaeon]
MNVDEEVISEIEKRRKLADHYYDNFRKYYENKNYSKASEFLWGSLNALAYAIGLLHGEKVSDHGKVVNFINELANVYKDEEIEGCLASAQTIHANFFHDFMNDSMFEDNRKRTEKLLEKLVKILDAELKARLKG